MSVRIGINGFGRTGRAAFRAAFERDADIRWVGINDVMDKRTAAHLLKHDSTFGPFPGAIEVTAGGISAALGLVIPELAGRLHGYVPRVPVAAGSVVDLTIESERATSTREINEIFREQASSDALEDVLGYTDEPLEPLVSSDVIKSPRSAIFDAGLTSVIDGTCVKVVAWYDNEWGYSNRLVDVAQRVLAAVSQRA